MAGTRQDNAVALSRLTTFRIGGPPALYVRPAGYPELGPALERCRGWGLVPRILGGGSKLLVDDGELPFAVIHICSPGFDWIERTGPRTVRAGAGVRLARLLSYCREIGLGGLEFLAGIPGTVGGALAGNAGAWGSSIGERLVRLWSLDQAGRVLETPAQGVAFGYRTCSLGGAIVTEAELELEPRRPADIAGLMARNVEQKARRQPTDLPNAGCVFKNPPGGSAGKMLEVCGLKGLRVGGAEVSALHANFVCNVAGARTSDVLQLVEIMRESVRKRFEVELELELRLWQAERRVA